VASSHTAAPTSLQASTSVAPNLKKQSTTTSKEPERTATKKSGMEGAGHQTIPSFDDPFELSKIIPLTVLRPLPSNVVRPLAQKADRSSSLRDMQSSIAESKHKSFELDQSIPSVQGAFSLFCSKLEVPAAASDLPKTQDLKAQQTRSKYKMKEVAREEVQPPPRGKHVTHIGPEDPTVFGPFDQLWTPHIENICWAFFKEHGYQVSMPLSEALLDDKLAAYIANHEGRSTRRLIAEPASGKRSAFFVIGDNVHWNPVLVDVCRKEILTWDPYGNPFQSASDGELLRKLDTAFQGFRRRHLFVALQSRTDVVNCGVWACEMARMFNAFIKLRDSGSDVGEGQSFCDWVSQEIPAKGLHDLLGSRPIRLQKLNEGFAQRRRT
jgi:hypothetical protein